MTLCVVRTWLLNPLWRSRYDRWSRYRLAELEVSIWCKFERGQVYTCKKNRKKGSALDEHIGWLDEWVTCVRASVRPSCVPLSAQYRLQFLPDHFQTSLVNCWWWEGQPYWFLGHGAIGQGHILLSIYIILYFIFIIRRRLNIKLISCCLILYISIAL